MPAPGSRSAPGSPRPFGTLVAAVSVGIVDGEPRLDLAYPRTSDAGVDANVVMREPDRVRGSAGHRRAREPSHAASSTCCSTSPSAASPSSSGSSGRRSAGEAARRHPERRQAARSAPAPRHVRARGRLSRESASRGGRGRRSSWATLSRRTPAGRPSTSRSRLPTLADDCGLEVLRARRSPGVRSSVVRRSGTEAEVDEANNASCCAGWLALPEARRRARYRCVLVFLSSAVAVPPVLEGAAPAGSSRSRRDRRIRL